MEIHYESMLPNLSSVNEHGTRTSSPLLPTTVVSTVTSTSPVHIQTSAIQIITLGCFISVLMKRLVQKEVWTLANRCNFL